jgi:hypothetical protein
VGMGFQLGLVVDEALQECMTKYDAAI